MSEYNVVYGHFSLDVIINFQTGENAKPTLGQHRAKYNAYAVNTKGRNFSQFINCFQPFKFARTQDNATYNDLVRLLVRYQCYSTLDVKQPFKGQ